MPDSMTSFQLTAIQEFTQTWSAPPLEIFPLVHEVGVLVNGARARGVHPASAVGALAVHLAILCGSAPPDRRHQFFEQLLVAIRADFERMSLGIDKVAQGPLG